MPLADLAVPRRQGGRELSPAKTLFIKFMKIMEGMYFSIFNLSSTLWSPGSDQHGLEGFMGEHGGVGSRTLGQADGQLCHSWPGNFAVNIVEEKNVCRMFDTVLWQTFAVVCH